MYGIFNEEKVPEPIVEFLSRLGLFLGYNRYPSKFRNSIFSCYSMFGYFQWPSEIGTKHELKKLMPFIKKYTHIPEKINDDNRRICVGLRLGKDYLSAKHLCINYQEFLNKSFKVLLTKYPKSSFYIFTDNYEILDSLDIPVNSYVIKENSIFDKLMVMASFKDFIIMNSTYLWWPIFLSDLEDDSIVVLPEKWYSLNSYDLHPLQRIATDLI